MKKMWNYFASILVMGLFAGCSNDTLTGDDSDGDLNGSKDAVYMNVSVQLPAGGGIGARSKTDTPDKGDYVTSTDKTEEGKDYENRVDEVLLVLATTKNEFIAHSIIETDKKDVIKELKSSSFNTTKKISKSELAAYYDKKGDANGDLKDAKVHVYVFCNPTQDLKNKIKKAALESTDWVNEIATVEAEKVETENSDVWGGKEHKGGFLMSNAMRAEKTLPKNMEDWKDYASETTAFDLSGWNNYGTDKEVNNSESGAIKVERSVARFDFRDGSSIETDANTYDVVKKDGNTIMQIQLQKIALVNMSKEFYYLRRVSNDGLGAGTICGVETSNNYVVDTDADYKNGTIDINSYGDHFNYCLGNVDGGIWKIDQEARKQWAVYEIAKILAPTAEDDNYKDKEYKIWRYVTENTIPGETGNQKQGISTGIVFKGKMVVPDGADETSSLVKAINNVKGESMTDDILYTYLTNIYVTWKEVRKAALQPDASQEFYKAVFGDPEKAGDVKAEVLNAAGEVETPAKYSDNMDSPDYLWAQWHENQSNIGKPEYWESFRAAAVRSLFTIYQSSIDETTKIPGYYCYYFYWNRHNDNEKAGEMGPMEFAVVRNNVYKLAVTKIDRLGHPRISDNDPDPVDPEDPDEKGDVYLTLSVEVLPWVVRVNNIEF